MRSKPGFGRKAVLFLVAVGMMSCGPGCLQAQEPGTRNTTPCGSSEGKLDSRKPGEQVGTGPSSVNEQKVAAAREHRFWDRENDWLFAGVGASRTLDYFSTLNMRRRGRQEIFLTNDAVDNHAAFTVIEASATAVSIGAAYVFHHYGHHKLERWTSIVHIGLATTGAVRNYCLKTAHFAPAAGSP